MGLFRCNAMRLLKLSLALSSLLSIFYCAFVWKLHSEVLAFNSEWKKEYHRAMSVAVEKKNRYDEAMSAAVQINGPAVLTLLPQSAVESRLLKDYHNYTLMSIEAKQQGPGEHGEPYHLPASVKKQREELYRANGFNARASDDIALNRTLKDIRHPKCQDLQYPIQLPTVSVVVPFHNEHLSTLLRTAISVVNRSPRHLLLEVLLVDDASTKSFLGPSLDIYLAANVPLARVVRLKQRSGLITARLAGAREARGEVLVFLDSHTECTNNWLPPLLEPISRDYRTAVCPFIDVIDYETFEYRAQDEGARGGFDWELYYKRLPLTKQDTANMPQPFRSPVMAGGLFAISRRFFWELGGYDPGLQIWGGEQYELSFKLWQCGGTMLDAPCSRVGHVYRKYAPFPNPGIGDYLGKNYKRVAEVWMDEYAEFVYKHRPHYRRLDPGDITEQIALRTRLQCKPFKWFMKEIAFDLMRVYPPVEPPNFASGELSPANSPALCVGTSHRSNGDRVILKHCNGGGHNNMVFTWHKDIRPGGQSRCFDVSSNDKHSPVTLYNCHGMGGNQLWRYRPSSQRLEHGGNNRCLDFDPVTEELFVASCNATADTQRWTVEKVDEDRLAHWDDDGYTLFP